MVPLLINILFLYFIMFSSILNFPPCFGERFWCYLTFWSGVVHLHIRQMGWPHHRVPCHGCIPSNLLLRNFIPERKPLGFGRQFWKYNLRRKFFFSSGEMFHIYALKWFIGRELNPSIGSFDIKSFNELRPGLILWVLVNISMLCEQATRRGGFDKVTDSMWLVLAFQTWYVADGLYNEV